MAESPLEFNGWARYPNSGRIRRQWEVQRVKDGADVKVGDLVEDKGPGEDPRIIVKRGSEYERVKRVPPDEAAEFFGSISNATLPAWDPPTGVDLEMLEGMKELRRALQSLPSRMRSGIRKLPAKLRQVADEVDPETSDGRVVGCLQVVREGSYSNTGGSFRIWRFLEDCPEIPAREHNHAGGPPHAVEGDELWQQPDRLTPWKLKRDEVEIGAPEDWQLRGAFGGSIPGWGEGWQEEPDEPSGNCSQKSETEGPHRDLYRYVSAETEGGGPTSTVEEESEYRTAVQAEDRGVFRFKGDLPVIGAERGDVLVYAYDLDDRPAEVRGALWGLEIRELELLREELLGRFDGGEHTPLKRKMADVLPGVFECLSGPTFHMIGFTEDLRGRGYFRARGLGRFLADKRKWGRRLSEFHHRLFLLKPHAKPERATRPIRAASDQSAAFELLAQVTEEGGVS